MKTFTVALALLFALALTGALALLLSGCTSGLPITGSVDGGTDALPCEEQPCDVDSGRCGRCPVPGWNYDAGRWDDGGVQ